MALTIQNTHLSSDERQKFLRISRIFEQAISLDDGDQGGAIEWLDTPIPALGNRRPLELIHIDIGASEVEDLIGRIAHGVLS